MRLLVRHPEHPPLSADRKGFEQELVELLVFAEQADHRADEEVAAMGVPRVALAQWPGPLKNIGE